MLEFWMPRSRGARFRAATDVRRRSGGRATTLQQNYRNRPYRLLTQEVPGQPTTDGKDVICCKMWYYSLVMTLLGLLPSFWSSALFANCYEASSVLNRVSDIIFLNNI